MYFCFNSTQFLEIAALKNQIFSIQHEDDFFRIAKEVFLFQYAQNTTYRSFVNHLHITPDCIQQVADIPFLPIEFFKSHTLISDTNSTNFHFRSSGTTGSNTSKHYVTDLFMYHQSFRLGFAHFIGNPNDYCHLALLPSYQERGGSSLIYMVEDFIKHSQYPQSGFYLHANEALKAILEKNIAEKVPTILWGVSYALLDWAEENPLPLHDIKIFETGGMKGRRKELTRTELHEKLKQAFQVPQIYSEYGMTELLSQAYLLEKELFSTPPWMKVLVRDTNDPLSYIPDGKTGGINIIDLANIHSVAFIATQDLGKKHSPTTFEVLGRFDNSDIRGCNLLL